MPQSRLCLAVELSDGCTSAAEILEPVCRVEPSLAGTAHRFLHACILAGLITAYLICRAIRLQIYFPFWDDAVAVVLFTHRNVSPFP